MFPYEVQTFAAWALALPCVVLWTLHAALRNPERRRAYAALLLVCLPGIMIAAEVAWTLGRAHLLGGSMTVVSYELVGALLSCLWLVVGPIVLAGEFVAARGLRAHRLLVAAHALVWGLTTLVAAACIVRV